MQYWKNEQSWGNVDANHGLIAKKIGEEMKNNLKSSFEK
jgi:hypothetical protein